LGYRHVLLSRDGGRFMPNTIEGGDGCDAWGEYWGGGSPGLS
jgi:hypothetical protein